MEDIRPYPYRSAGGGLTGARREGSVGPAAPGKAGASGETGGPSFRQALEEQLRQNSGVAFSKHAVNRAIQRNLPLSDESLARLNEGVRLAAAKNLADPLILVDRTAFLVNIKRHKVITTVDAEELKGNVFTNIDGTVII
jgi:flagellar operon protein